MNDVAWALGMAELQKSGLPGWPTDPAVSTTRSELYRRHLDDIADAAWLYAVAEAIRRETWFPTVAKLREYASGWAPTYPALPPGRTPEQLEADREATRRGLALVQATVAERLSLPTIPPPVQQMPAATPHDVEAERRREARLEVLRQQAAAITAAESSESAGAEANAERRRS